MHYIVTEGSVLVLEAAIHRLHICEDTLPIRFMHHHHVLNIQQRRNPGLFTEKIGRASSLT